MNAWNHSATELVKTLVQAGAQVNVRDQEGNTPLIFAALLDAPESVRVLLEAGAHVNVLGKEERETPYEIAKGEVALGAGVPAHECAGLLAEDGTLSPLAIDIEEHPALSPLNREFLEAIQHLDLDRAAAALAAGADVNATDRYGVSALAQAVVADDAEFCRFLLDAGADVNYANKRGVTAVLLATIHQELDVMKILLLNGADYHRKDNIGASAYSRSRGNTAVAKVFDETLASMGKEQAGSGEEEARQ